MKIRYTVTAIPKERGQLNKIYKNVYDIGHYYDRITSQIKPREAIRLLIGKPFDETQREYIDLAKYNVLIEMETIKEEI